MKEIYFQAKQKAIRRLAKDTNCTDPWELLQRWKQQAPGLPQILGMTASPLIKEVKRSHSKQVGEQFRNILLELCHNLDSNYVCYDPELSSKHLSQPSLVTLPFDSQDDLTHLIQPQNEVEFTLSQVKTKFPEMHQIYMAFEQLTMTALEPESGIYDQVKEFIMSAKNIMLNDFIYFGMEIGQQSLLFILSDLILYCERLLQKLHDINQQTLSILSSQEGAGPGQKKAFLVRLKQEYKAQTSPMADTALLKLNHHKLKDMQQFFQSAKGIVKQQIQTQDQKYSHKFMVLLHKIQEVREKAKDKEYIMLIFVKRRILAQYLNRIINNVFKTNEDHKSRVIMGQNYTIGKRPRAGTEREFTNKKGINDKVQAFMENNEMHLFRVRADAQGIENEVDFERRVKKFYMDLYRRKKKEEKANQEEKAASQQLEQELATLNDTIQLEEEEEEEEEEQEEPMEEKKEAKKTSTPFSYYSARCSAEEQAQLIQQLRAQKGETGMRILVATDVVEEGLDIPKCNMVLSYNEVHTLTQFIQVQGRARARESEYVVLVRQGTEQREQERLGRFRQEARLLKQLTWDMAGHHSTELVLWERQAAPVVAKIRKDNFVLSGPRVVETDYQYTFFRQSPYLLNTNWAMELLANYCRLLSRRYESDDDTSSGLVYNVYKRRQQFYVIIKMPEWCVIPFGHLQVASTKEQAKKRAAFEMMVQLYKRELLNSQLCPKMADETAQPVEVVYDMDNYDQFIENNLFNQYFSNQQEKQIFFNVMKHHSKRVELRQTYSDGVMIEHRMYYFAYGNEFLQRQVGVGQQQYMYRIKMSQVGKDGVQQEDVLGDSENQVGILSPFLLFDGEQCFSDCLSNVSQNRNSDNGLRVTFELQEERVELDSQEQLVWASHFIYATVKDLDVAFYSLLANQKVNPTGYFAKFLDRKEKFRKDLPTRLQPWQDNPYILFTVLGRNNQGGYSVDWSKIEDIVQYMVYFQELFENLNRDAETIGKEGKVESLGGIRQLSRTNQEKGLVSPIGYYDKLRQTNQYDNTRVIQNIITMNKNFNAGTMTFQRAQKELLKMDQTVLEDKLEQIKGIVEPCLMKKEVLVKLGSIKKLNDRYYSSAFIGRTALASLQEMLLKNQKDHFTNQFFYIYNFSQEFVEHPLEMTVFLSFRQLICGDLMGVHFRDHLKIRHFRDQFLTKLETNCTPNKYILEQEDGCPIVDSQPQAYQIRHYPNPWLLLLLSDPSFGEYLHNNYPHLLAIPRTSPTCAVPVCAMFYSLDTYLNVTCKSSAKQTECLSQNIPVDLLKQALSTESYSSTHNYETLEFLGDSILKLLSSVEVFLDHFVDQNILNHERKTLVANEFLKNKCIVHKMFAYILSERQPFIPPGFINLQNQHDQEAGDRPPQDMLPGNYQQLNKKQLADVVESLIAVYYLLDNNIDHCQKLLYMLKILKRPTMDGPQITSIPRCDALLAHPFYSKRVAQVEQILQYSFRDKHLLVQALVHPNLGDVMREHLVEKQPEITIDNLSLNYERPEFLGDAVLDLVVTEVLYHNLDKYGLGVGDYTSLRSSIVRNISLAQVVLQLQLEGYLQDKTNPTHTFHQALFTNHRDTLVAVSPEKFFYEAACCVQAQYNRETFLLQLERYLKVLADILEALIGVVYLDSGLNYSFMRKFLLRQEFMGWMVNLRVATFLEQAKKGHKQQGGRSQEQDERLRQKDQEMQQQDRL